ncbi:hypothetical protein DENSPDRAFT_886629, partial [Dentipellis sp. KUC8613]
VASPPPLPADELVPKDKLVPRELAAPVGPGPVGPVFHFLGAADVTYDWPRHLLSTPRARSSIRAGRHMPMRDFPVAALRVGRTETDPTTEEEVDGIFEMAE